MKLITAISAPSADQVRQALIKAEITRITVTRCAGRARRRASRSSRLDARARAQGAARHRLQRRVRPADDRRDPHRGAGEGEVGDGKIFVTELQQCIRIRTGESGGTAI